MGRNGSTRGRRRRQNNNLEIHEELTEYFIQIEEETKRTTHHSINNVVLRPKNNNQRKYLSYLKDPAYSLVIASGPAGTGKTLFAVHVAINDFISGNINKIVLTRPTSSVDEDLGFLPGTLEEKMEPWLKPIYDIFADFYNPKELKKLIETGHIEICPLAYMRGRTFKDTWIIADEMQNATINQVKMLLTRIGKNSRMVLTGDLAQHDRNLDENGLFDFIRRLPPLNPSQQPVQQNSVINSLPTASPLLSSMEYSNNQPTEMNLNERENDIWSMVRHVKFTNEDIERHPLISKVLKLYGDH